MSGQTRTLKATCLCGNSAHEIKLSENDLPIKEAYMCHCDSCRHMTGSLCLTVAFLPSYYQPAQSSVDKLTGFAFSKRITQYFCPTCGCFMLARCLKDGDDPSSDVTWDVTTGTLEHIDDIIEWGGHEFVQDTVDGGFADHLVEVHGKRLGRWPAHFGEGEEMPLYWSSSTRPRVQISPDDKLRGHCKCGGVDFYVARPSARSAMAEKAWPKLPTDPISETDIPPAEETYWLCDNGTKYAAGLCACNSCRLASGMETTFWSFVPTVDLSLDEKGQVPFTLDFRTLKKYTSSPGCHRYFCGTCGATCFYDADDRQFFKDVSIGLLAAQEGARAETWLGWRTNRLGFREDAAPRAEGFTIGVETALRAWEEQREGPNLRERMVTGGAL